MTKAGLANGRKISRERRQRDARKRDEKLSRRFKKLSKTEPDLNKIYELLAAEFDIKPAHVAVLTLKLRLRKRHVAVAQPPRKKDRPNPSVYVVLAPEVQRVKIGYSRHVQRRFESLQANSPILLRFLGYVPQPQAKKLEFTLHQKLSPHRSHCEWYIWNEHVRAILEGLPLAEPERPLSTLAPKLSA